MFCLPLVILPELALSDYLVQFGTVAVVGFFWFLLLKIISLICQSRFWPKKLSMIWGYLLAILITLALVSNSNILLSIQKKYLYFIVLCSLPYLFQEQVKKTPLLFLSSAFLVFASIGTISILAVLKYLPWQSIMLVIGTAITCTQNEVTNVLTANNEYRKKLFLRFHSVMWGFLPLILLVLIANKDLDHLYMLPLISLVLCSRLVSALRSYEFEGSLPSNYSRIALIVVYLQLFLLIISRLLMPYSSLIYGINRGISS